jgi:2,3-bisphosphoglycerate-dependent phosphoglycerate mutase
MAAEVCHHAIGSLQSHSHLGNLNHHQNIRSGVLRLATKDFICSNGLSKGISSRFGQRNCIVIRSSASHSQTSVVDPVLSPSKSNTNDTSKKSSMINFMSIYFYCFLFVPSIFLLVAS